MRNRKIIAFSSALLLTAAVFAGCGNTKKTISELRAEMESSTYNTIENDLISSEFASEYNSVDSEKVKMALPDLSELGIDVSTFPEEGEKKIYECGVGYELAYEGERPKTDEIRYTNPNHDVIYLDENGTLLGYENANIYLQVEAPKIVLSEAKLKETAEKYFKLLVPDRKNYSEGELESGDVMCKYVAAKKDGGDNFQIILDKQGNVLAFYMPVLDNIKDPAVIKNLRKQVREYADIYCKENCGKNYEVSEISGYCKNIDGISYGFYTFVVSEKGTSDNPDQRRYGVIVRSE